MEKFMLRLCFMCGLVFVGLALAGQTSPLFAQGKKAPKPAVIAAMDMTVLRIKSKAGQSIVKQFNDRRKALLKQASKVEKELFEAREALKRQLSLLSPDAVRQRDAALKKKFRAARQKFQSQNKNLEKQVAAAWGIFNKELRNVLEGIVKAKNIDVILATRQTIYSSPKLDVTTETLKRLDKILPKVVVGKKAK